jgi:superfamily I DNA and/or RNA helicase
LSPSDLGKFENVIIDEASMALLPAAYFVASQSQRRCIISGDFRQIPVIVQNEEIEEN